MAGRNNIKNSLPAHARVVVIGGGNMGTSVLYHLAKEGWTDCVLLEKAELTSGATWHAAGLVSHQVTGQALGKLHDYAVELYRDIEQTTEQSVSWHQCGSMRVATTALHQDWITHIYDCVRARGQRVEIIGPAEIQRLNPLYQVEANKITTAVFTPDDGHVDPAGTCFAMAKGARGLGARVIRKCRVINVTAQQNNEWLIETTLGSIRCEHVVNAGGYHAKQIGFWSGLDLPITTMQHHYVVTDDVSSFDDMDHEIPVTRDDHYCGYMRREQRGVLIGLYDKQEPQPKWLDGCPWTSEHELFEPDWDAITPWLQNFFERCPSLRNHGIKRVVNGGITYTPDGSMLLGPAPGIRNYWLACGATVGIAWGPGAGRTLAQWMVYGTAEVSTRAFDPRRFGIWVDSEYATARAIEDYSMRISLPVPGQQKWSKRGIKVSGAHGQTCQLGAIFEDAGGWERPRWFALDQLPAQDIVGYHRGKHFGLINQECKAVRERVALGDFSAFAKFDMKGIESDSFLNRVCANRISTRIGSCTLTHLLNRQGTIEGEATVVRLNNQHFYFITGAPSERRMWDWLTIHERGSENLSITNRTDDIGLLVLAGPDSRKVLQTCTKNDVSNQNFPWLTTQSINISGIQVLALRLSFTGDLAWELHADNSQLGSLWDVLWKAGQQFGIRAFGSQALDSLRMEKKYRSGHELGNDATPLDAGLERLVKLDKPFIGHKSLKQQKKTGSTFQLVMLEMNSQYHEPLGGEAVFVNGMQAGSICSAAYGHYLKKSLAFTYIPSDLDLTEAKFEVSLFGELCQAHWVPQIPFDPHNLRLKA